MGLVRNIKKSLYILKNKKYIDRLDIRIVKFMNDNDLSVKETSAILGFKGYTLKRFLNGNMKMDNNRRNEILTLIRDFETGKL